MWSPTCGGARGTLGTAVLRFLSGKSAVLPSVAADWDESSDTTRNLQKQVQERKKYDARAALLDLFAPMSVVDMYEQYAHNGARGKSEFLEKIRAERWK